MTTQTEALKLALEAGFTYNDKICLYQASETQLKIFLAIAHAKALAQPEQPKVRTGDCLLVGVCASEGHKIQKAQPEQEPVARVVEHGATVKLEWASADAAHNAKVGNLYTTPPQRKPLTDEQIDAIADKFTVHTGEMWEPELCIEFNDSCKSVHSFARAIEAAHDITG